MSLHPHSIKDIEKGNIKCSNIAFKKLYLPTNFKKNLFLSKKKKLFVNFPLYRIPSVIIGATYSNKKINIYINMDDKSKFVILTKIHEYLKYNISILYFYILY